MFQGEPGGVLVELAHQRVDAGRVELRAASSFTDETMPGVGGSRRSRPPETASSRT